MRCPTRSRSAACSRRRSRGKKPEDRLFTRKNGQPVNDFRKTWQKLCVQFGLGKLVCPDCGKALTKHYCKCGSKRRVRYEGLIVHDMRRTAARNARRAGVAEGVIMKMGGWLTRSMFDRYNIVDESDQREALERIERKRAEEQNWRTLPYSAENGKKRADRPNSAKVN